MENDSKAADENPSKGTDWEVVSLTSSTYAATPASKEYDASEKHKDEFNKTEPEYSGSMFMSKHFIFPPGEPETLEPDCSEIYKERGIQYEDHINSEKFNEQKGKLDTENDLHGSQLFDEIQIFSGHRLDFRDDREVEDQKLVENNQAFYISPKYSSLRDQADVSQSIHHAESTSISEPDHLYHEQLNYPFGNSIDSNLNEKNRNKESDHSHESWWKKQVMSIYHHAKETNTFWSIFVAVAVAGVVILGKRWSREKSQMQQPKWKFVCNAEKINAMAVPIGRFKDIILSGHQPASMHRVPYPTI